MTKESKKSIWVISACIVVILLGFFFYWLLFDHAVVFDLGGTRLEWKGNRYILITGMYDHVGKVLAKTGVNGQIVEVGDDKTHTFLVLQDSLDDHIYVREDYMIPTSGQITKAYWGRDLQDEDFCDTLTQILANAKTDLQYSTDAPYTLVGGREMYQLYVGYDHCPIATENLGYLGTINGVWCITTGIEEKEDGQYLVSCYQIPLKYVSLLQSFQ